MSSLTAADQKITSQDIAISTENGSIEEGISKDVKGKDEALKYVQLTAIEIDENTEKRIRHKIDRRLLPWMCILYLLQYLDKTTLSYAAAMGIKADTSMSSFQYSWSDDFIQH